MLLARLLAVPTLVTTVAIAAAACTSAEVTDDVAASEDALTGRIAAGASLRTTANVNLREEATTNSRSLEVLDEGTTVIAVDADPSDGFYRVRHGTDVGWVHGNYLRAGTPGNGGGDEFDGRQFSGVTLLWQGNWDFLLRCDSYSRGQGRVVFFCDERPSRSFVDDGNWIAVPRAYFSRSLCGQEARVCKGGRCVNAKIVEKSETTGKWEGSTAVLEALGTEVGFRSCTNSFGSATGVSVTFR